MKANKHFSYREKEIDAGNVYHITQRAPGKDRLFVEDNDYLTLLFLLKKACKDYKLEIFAFCLMPNHFHLLLKINQPNLSKAMHSLNTAYALRFNSKYQRKGHVFCGVYRASRCLDDIHLVGSSIYIHLNPWKARIANSASGYRWSSAGTYINLGVTSFVNSKFILKMIDEDLNLASHQYQDILQKSYSVDYENIIENPRAVVNFCKTTIKSLLGVLRAANIKKDFIAYESKLDVMIDDFSKDKRKRGLENKKAVTYLIEQLRSRGYNIKEIANKLNISRQTLYKYSKFSLHNKLNLKCRT